MLNLLQKALRLARLTNNVNIQAFLQYEIFGYPGSDDALNLAEAVGRLTNRQNRWGYWEPLPAIAARIDTSSIQLQQLRVPDVHWPPHTQNPYDHVGRPLLGPDPISGAISSVINQQNALRETIATLNGIVSRVIGSIHRWVANVYHELLFSAQQETIFQQQKARVDTLLADRCGDALRKIEAVYERLAVGDAEAVSQALLTCRRILDSICDAIQPSSHETVTIGGEALEVTAHHTKNRYRVYLHARCASASRRDRLRQTMGHLYDRTGTAVHNEVTPEEAQFLFLQIYLFVGEILSLPNLPPPPVQPPQLSDAVQN